MIYLDNAATTWPKPPEVLQAMQDFMSRDGGNAGRGKHGASMQAARRIYQVRELLCQLFGFPDPSRVVFTVNATHALNQALFGLLKPGDHVIASSMEHNSVTRPLKVLGEQGVEVTYVPGRPEEVFSLEAYREAFRSNTRLVVTTHASNVTGQLLPVNEIGETAREKGALYLLDAAQTAGVFSIDLGRMPVDLLAFPGHKGLLGPQGTGGLMVGHGIQLKPLLVGGTGSHSERDSQPDFLPDALESGTLNGVGIAGLGAGIEYILRHGVEHIRNAEQSLCRRLQEGLSAIPEVTLYGCLAMEKKAPIVSFNIGEMDSMEASFYLEQHADIVARAGLHCAPHAHRLIGTIERGVLRFSPSHFTSVEEIDQAIASVERLAKEDKMQI